MPALFVGGVRASLTDSVVVALRALTEAEDFELADDLELTDPRGEAGGVGRGRGLVRVMSVTPPPHVLGQNCFQWLRGPPPACPQVWHV